MGLLQQFMRYDYLDDSGRNIAFSAIKKT